MEAALWAMVFLLATGATRAGPAGGSACELKPIHRPPHMDVSYTQSKVPRGCVGGGSPREVHVLNVNQSQVPTSALNVTLVTGSRLSEKPIIVINAIGFITFSDFPQDLEPEIYLQQSSFAMTSTLQLLPVQSAELASDSQELLLWARGHFGAVTSFAELHSPSAIRLTVGSDGAGRGPCALQEGFSLRGVLEWDSHPAEMIGCQISGEGGQREAHAVVIDDQEEESSGQTDIELLSDPECAPQQDQVLLILQSRGPRRWSIQSRHPLRVMTQPPAVSWVFISRQTFRQDEARVLPSPEEVTLWAQQEGFDRMWFTQMPPVQRITIRLQSCQSEVPVTVADVGSTVPSVEDRPTTLNEQITQILKLVNPWRCTSDYLSISLTKAYLQAAGGVQVQELTLLNSSCRAEQNDTHIFLTTRTDRCLTSIGPASEIQNQLLLTVDTLAEPVVVPFVCVPPSVELSVYGNPDFTTPSESIQAGVKTYAQVSVSGAAGHALLRLQECSLTQGTEKGRVLIARDAPKMPTMQVLEPVEVDSTQRLFRFTFVHRAPAGPPACTGVLACALCLEPDHATNCSDSKLMKASLDLSITGQSPTSLGQDQGLGTGAVLGITFGAFLIGALLTAALWFIYSHTRSSARKQPVPTKAVASESSSANQSIGSTQSTPCSTSSMA
ncbi:endoglin [Lissotriton helveticus]